MNKNELIYLASPYSHPDQTIRELRVKQVCECAGKLMEQGLLVFCPIAHTHLIAEAMTVGLADANKLGYEAWQRQDEAMLSRCDRLVVCRIGGWTESKGIKAEVDFWINKLGRTSIGWVYAVGDPQIEETPLTTQWVLNSYALVVERHTQGT